ncbi:MAG: DUF494 domain-containing protein [Legionellales bacterium]|nr:DUF494 domain-containing protein [Legionellales bacterium]
MSENVLDVLIYLVENVMLDGQLSLSPEMSEIKSQLENAGFSSPDITKALQWVDDLKNNNFHYLSKETSSTFRIFSPDEQKKLTPAIRFTLHCLERDEVITPISREIIIDRLLALDFDEVHSDQLKWVLFFVLCFRGEHPVRIQRMENTLLLDNPSSTVH